MDHNAKHLHGFINLPSNEDGAIYNGNYNNVTGFLSNDFLQFEHTNGLNYVFVEIARYNGISTVFHLPNIDKFQINITEGIGLEYLFLNQIPLC
ncbi:hypothetical protein ACFOX1_02760 [Mariniflexile soesokkakense]